MSEILQLPFQSVIGQLAARETLRRAIESGRMAHAYLFLGPEGSGKRALALELARVLSCAKGPIDSTFGCNCRSCNQMTTWRHPNLITVFPLPSLEKEKGVASDKTHAEILDLLAKDSYAPLRYTGTGKILIDHVREARNKVSLSPGQSGTRVVFVHPADRMNDQAANALLKLLEEPPDRCQLVLTAMSRRDLLPTILSRCQQIRFRPLPAEEITKALTERTGIASERAKRLADLSMGSYTRALQLSEQKADAMTADGIEFLRAAATGNAGKIAHEVDKWLADDASRAEIYERLQFTGLWILDAMASIAAKEEGVSLGMRISGGDTSVVKMGERYGIVKLQGALSEIEETRLALEANALQGLALTVLAIKLKRIFQ